MMSRTVELLTRRPDLLLDHATAYVTLAKDEATKAKTGWIIRIASGVLAGVFGMAALIVVSIALMMQLSGHSEFTPQAWLVPAAIFAIALIAALRFRRKTTVHVGQAIAAQLRADANLFREFTRS